MTQRIDTAAERAKLRCVKPSRREPCLTASADLITGYRAALDEIDRLERLALRAFTVVEWVVGEGMLLSTPHEDADDLLLDMVDFLAVEDSASAQASLAAMDTLAPEDAG